LDLARSCHMLAAAMIHEPARRKIWSILPWRTRRAPPSIPPDYRVYAVGDVHGRADLLADVQAAIDHDLVNRPIAMPVEIYLGDYIDRGPHSRSVIDLLVGRLTTRGAICLRGNHEAMMEAFLDDPQVLRAWAKIGGLATIASYGVGPPPPTSQFIEREIWSDFNAAFPRSHDLFLQCLASHHSIGDFFFVHAGIRPGVALDRQEIDDMLWIRDEFLQSKRDFGAMVVHGHTPVSAPELCSNRINIDTGAFATGCLTCVVIEGSDISFL
jgi:serine/threonine protein phosphatase 1